MRRIWITVGLTAAVWTYFAILVATWLVLDSGGDRWWWATLILFGPRWVCILPLVVLTPAAGWLQRRALWTLAACTVIAVGPIMGFCVPWGRLWAGNEPGIRILTCNLKGHCRDNPQLDALIRESRPDLVAFEGCWGPVRIAWPENWHVHQVGELLIASRFPFEPGRSLIGLHPPHNWPQVDFLQSIVQIPGGELHLCVLHFPSPRIGLSSVVNRETIVRPSQSDVLAREIANRGAQSKLAAEFAAPLGPNVIIAGDFNTTADSRIYRRDWAGYGNAFSQTGFGLGHTMRPTVRGWQFGVRIDHILFGPAWRAKRCWLGPEVGSDHLPVLADLYLTAQGMTN